MVPVDKEPRELAWDGISHCWLSGPSKGLYSVVDPGETNPSAVDRPHSTKPSTCDDDPVLVALPRSLGISLER